MKRLVLALAATTVLVAGCGDRKPAASGQAPSAGSGQGSAGIWAAGSSTVFPFATRVAENFARKTGSPPPRIESLGTGGGVKAFCQGPGSDTPDIATASRPMKASEFDACQAAGVKDIVELRIGNDGIVIANAKAGGSYDFTLKDIYMGLAKELPQGSGFAPNPYAAWKDVSGHLPAERIQVYGPPPTSGTRDAFLELAMSPGAEQVPQLKALKASDKDSFKARSETLRQDGGWVDAGENDNAIVQTLTATPGSLGVFGYSYLEQNMDKVKGARINGVAPSLQTISDHSYPLSRSLYIYVKKAHLDLKPSLKAFVGEFLSDAAAGRGGYLQDRGLIPLPEAELAGQRQAATALTPMARPKS